MPALIPPQIIDLLLLGAPNRRRQLQDLPILGDVWAYLADARSADPPDLLIIPNRDRSAAQVADLLYAPGEYHNMTIGGGSETEVGPRSVAYLNGLVVATLSFDDLVEHVLPFTIWWDRIEKSPNRRKWADGAIQTWIEVEIRNLLAEADSPVLPRPVAEVGQQAPDGPSQQVARLGLLLGVFAAADVHMQAFVERGSPDWMSLQLDPPRLLKAFVDYVELERIIGLGSQCIHRITDRYKKVPKKSAAECHGAIFQVTLNRAAELAVVRSVPAIKGDAARSLFSISCERLGWAVLDSGIDHEHQAFLDQKKTQQLIMEAADLKAEPKAGHPHRIRAAFEFKRIRAILGVKTPEVAAMATEISQQNGLPQVEASTRLQKIIDDRLARLPVDWRNIEPLIQLDLANPAANRPTHPHGTHVAGIIGADWQVRNDSTRNFDVKMQGVCPDIGLYDFRVLGSSLGDSEFAVSAALQFIRYYNEQVGFQRIHGVNMSLAIRHNVRNYACGQTPVCVQAEALVASGVVVVAAAGNRGYQKYQLEDNSTFEGYASSSITDPGNADGVITVGATHRSWPHTYGVSFFSSRGPTGDGRLKPDLLAPGEKIESCIPGGGQDVMDGTSMAAPHVSGAAALLMARHEELKGRPDRIKEILCSTATDLKRERHFQGYGMVDVLRAIQSI